MSGIYENTGVLVATDAKAAPEEVSFQGLLSLDFNYAVTRAQQTHIDRVIVRQNADRCLIECRDRDGVSTWRGEWERGSGYHEESARVVLTSRARFLKDDSILFSLRLTGDTTKLLEVEISRVQATTFGPVIKPLGAFLFAQIASQPDEEHPTSPPAAAYKPLEK